MRYPINHTTRYRYELKPTVFDPIYLLQMGKSIAIQFVGQEKGKSLTVKRFLDGPMREIGSFSILDLKRCLHEITNIECDDLGGEYGIFMLGSCDRAGHFGPCIDGNKKRNIIGEFCISPNGDGKMTLVVTQINPSGETVTKNLSDDDELQFVQCIIAPIDGIKKYWVHNIYEIDQILRDKSGFLGIKYTSDNVPGAGVDVVQRSVKWLDVNDSDSFNNVKQMHPHLEAGILKWSIGIKSVSGLKSSDEMFNLPEYDRNHIDIGHQHGEMHTRDGNSYFSHIVGDKIFVPTKVGIGLCVTNPAPYIVNCNVNTGNVTKFLITPTSITY